MRDMMLKGVCVMIIRANYLIPLVPIYQPLKGLHKEADPGLQVHQVEKAAFRRDREFKGQTGFGGREGRETFSECYNRLLQLQNSTKNQG